MNYWNEIAVIAVLILLNAVLSMSEAALLSSRKARLQQLSNEGDHGSGKVLKLLEDPNIFLSTVQIGITLVGVFAGAIGGATLSEALAVQLAKIPLLAPYSETLAISIVVLTITTLTIWLGELVPKRLALQSPERIARTVAGPMLFVSRVFAPLVKLMSFGTNLVLRMLGVKPSLEPPITEEELHVLIDQGTQAGVFEEAEQDMVEGVFSLGDQRVYSLMTPRTEIVWLDIEDSIEEIRDKIAEHEISRFPVRQDTLDVILGIVKARDMLVASLSGGPIKLKQLLKPAFFIPETMSAATRPGDLQGKGHRDASGHR